MRGAAADAKRYRDGYPDLEDDIEMARNLDFYSNKLTSYPEGDLIDNIHKKWFGNYKLLERHHGFIQWLFPIRERGLNGAAQTLQLHEAKSIANSSPLKNRVIKSYEMMLNFFGMELANRSTGQITRHYNWKSRYEHLNNSSHNYLRITRILKFLGEIGLEKIQKSFRGICSS